jgi:hypothetical protein
MAYIEPGRAEKRRGKDVLTLFISQRWCSTLVENLRFVMVGIYWIFVIVRCVIIKLVNPQHVLFSLTLTILPTLVFPSHIVANLSVPPAGPRFRRNNEQYDAHDETKTSHATSVMEVTADLLRVHLPKEQSCTRDVIGAWGL